MTKAAQIHERIEAAVASGTPKADAFRELADDSGSPPKSVQGAYYAHNRKTRWRQHASGAQARDHHRRRGGPGHRSAAAVAQLH